MCVPNMSSDHTNGETMETEQKVSIFQHIPFHPAVMRKSDETHNLITFMKLRFTRGFMNKT